MTTTQHLVPFLVESFKIEGILRPPFPSEIEATQKFLDLRQVTVADMSALVTAYQPGAMLRNRRGLNVRVGKHVPPPGGAGIPKLLGEILADARDELPYRTHQLYEQLHPYTDGNGRSGRALWAWQMVRAHGSYGLVRGFLHEWYYQSLG